MNETRKMKKAKVTRKRIKRVALEVATRTYYDADDHKQGRTPITEYPEVEKALIKWLKQIGVEIKK